MSPRPDITMTVEEIHRFLDANDEVLVVALQPGAPPAGAVGQLLWTDGELGFDLDVDDPVVALLEADDRVCCVVEQFPSYFEIKGAMFHGRAHRRPDGPVNGVATFAVERDDTVSFDFGKLPEAQNP
jgi:hypothetical protein